MEKFKANLKKRMIRWIVCTAIAVVVILISFLRVRAGGVNSHVDSFMAGFQIGLFAAGAMISITNIYQCIKALKSDEECRKLYIKENDERDKTIKDKAANMTFWTAVGCLMVSSIVVGFYNMTVFITLLVVLFVMLVIMLVYKLIYSKIL